MKLGRPKNKFCPKGHDISIVGRNKSHHCKQCKKIGGRKDPSKDSRIKEFCIKGHKITIVGRDKWGHCIECVLIDHRQYVKSRGLLDLNFKLTNNLRARLHTAIKNNIKVGSAIKDLGCSIEFFKNYIEAKFHGNMTWGNWGRIWELDHIEELHTFDLTDRQQLLRAVHYTNLQPLTIKDHYKKSAHEKKKSKV